MIPIHANAAPPAVQEQTAGDTQRTSITTAPGVCWLVKSNPRIRRQRDPAGAKLRLFKMRTSPDPQP